MNVKNEIPTLIYKLSCVFAIIVSIAFTIVIMKLCYLEVTSAKNELESKEINQGKILIWNDDIESIPVDGTFVKIDFTEGNKIYLTPIE